MKIITARPHRLLNVCIDRICELAEEGKNCMFLVPPQYTLQAEIEIMSRLHLSGSFSIDVLSPTRLVSRVFERAGEPDRIVFDERGKCMILSEIIEQEKEELTVYKAAAFGSGMGLAKKLSAVISDFKRSGVTAQALLEVVQSMPQDSAAKKKLTDIARIYGEYESRMQGLLADGEDVARIVREKMSRSGVLDGQHVIIYGFDMITPTFAADIVHMDALAKSVMLTVEADKNSAADGRLFAPVNASIERLVTLAKESGLQVERERIECEVDACEEIRMMEQGLFALGSKLIEGEPEGITLSAAGNPRTEVHMAAAKMRRMFMDGTDPADMAVVYPKTGGYGPLLENILPMYGIPVYVAQKRAAGTHPLCRFLLASLAVISGGWRTSDVIECIQSGFMELTQEEADALCSYAEGVDLRQEAWTRPFTYIKKGTQETLDSLNRSREKVAAPLIALRKSFSNAKSADDIVKAVIELLDDVGAYERLDGIREELKSAGFDAESEDCAQVWNGLMETLDQLHTLLGGRNVSAGVILELIEAGLSAMELGALPPTEGAVICGEIGNVRTARVKTVFAIGMNDAASGSDSALLNEPETQEAASATGAYLGMRPDERAALAQLDILKALTTAREKLVVSYALADETGRALREGIAVQSLKRLFPELKTEVSLAQEELEEMLCAPLPAAQALSVLLSEAADHEAQLTEKAAQAYAALSTQEDGRKRLLAITKKLGDAQRERLDSARAYALYGRPVMSVTRLETYAQCPYRHFVRYGLAPQEEQSPGVDYAELGTLYHTAAEMFTKAVTQLKEFPQVEPEICDSIMEEAIAPLIEEWRASPLGKSARGASIAARIERTAKRAGKNIVAQFAESSFKPIRSELVFGYNGLSPLSLELHDGTVIHLQGRIDRIDLLDDQKHIRVIDYKSGTKKFDPTMVYWGLQLQLLLYLAAALSQIPGSKAAGFFYCRIADPTIQSESRIKEEIEKQIAKKLAIAGISLSEVEILRAQGEAHAAMITKDGKPNARNAGSMVDKAGMEAIVAFAKRKAAELASDAYAGMIDDAPAEYGQFVACSFCDYAAVCGFDPSRQRRRRLTQKKLEDLR